MYHTCKKEINYILTYSVITREEIYLPRWYKLIRQTLVVQSDQHHFVEWSIWLAFSSKVVVWSDVANVTGSTNALTGSTFGQPTSISPGG